jgi:hypothetical protein
MMFTNTNKMIYAEEIECHKAVIAWYQQIIFLQCKQDI